MIGRYVTLAFLSAITAEFLLGDQWLSGGAVVVTTQIAEGLYGKPLAGRTPVGPQVQAP